jgi:hypothetical protein
MTAFVDYYWRLPVKAYKSARRPVSSRHFSAGLVLARLPCLFKTVFCMHCTWFCRNFIPHICWISGYQFLVIKSGISNQVWSCLNMSEHVLINIWSCLIMFDQLSADILPSLIKFSDRVWSSFWSCLIMSDHVWSTVGRNTGKFD